MRIAETGCGNNRTMKKKNSPDLTMSAPDETPKQKNSRAQKATPPSKRAPRKTPASSAGEAAKFAPLPPADKRQTVIVCFGTMSISGDSLGPMVGTLLAERYNVPAFVYGTEKCSVNGKNMAKWLSFIKQAHRGALFIAVDASLGTPDKVGQIVIRPDGVCPAAIKGKTERFGDVGILGVVAENKGDALMQLMSVSPLYVEELADKVAVLLKQAI